MSPLCPRVTAKQALLRRFDHRRRGALYIATTRTTYDSVECKSTPVHCTLYMDGIDEPFSRESSNGTKYLIWALVKTNVGRERLS